MARNLAFLPAQIQDDAISPMGTARPARVRAPLSAVRVVTARRTRPVRAARMAAIAHPERGAVRITRRNETRRILDFGNLRQERSHGEFCGSARGVYRSMQNVLVFSACTAR